MRAVSGDGIGVAAQPCVKLIDNSYVTLLIHEVVLALVTPSRKRNASFCKGLCGLCKIIQLGANISATEIIHTEFDGTSSARTLIDP